MGRRHRHRVPTANDQVRVLRPVPPIPPPARMDALGIGPIVALATLAGMGKRRRQLVPVPDPR